MGSRVWPRWVEGLFARFSGRAPPKHGQIPKQDTLARRLDSAVRGAKERDLLRGAEESLRRGRRSEAIRAYAAALEVFMDRGAYQKAIAVLTNLTRLEPETPLHFEKLAEVQDLVGRRREAEASRRYAVALLEGSGAHTHAGAQAAPRSSPPSGPAPRDRGGPPDPARVQPTPAPRDPSGSSNLGRLEDRPDAPPPEHLRAEPPAPPRGEERPPRRAPSLPDIEPLAPRVPPADTDASPPSGARTPAQSAGDDDADDALELPEDDELTLGPLPAADPDPGGDQTLLDPGAGSAIPAPKPVGRPRGLSLPTDAPPSKPSRPTRTGGPRGLAIPGASTVLDPRGSSALADSEHGRRRQGAPDRGRD
jgi:hypothetical protein